MAASFLDALTGAGEQKKDYNAAVARLQDLPEPYARAAAAVHRYVMYAGGVVDGEEFTAATIALSDLWRQAAAEGARVSDVVGDDPVAFAERVAGTYSGRRWINRERARLRQAIAEADQAR